MPRPTNLKWRGCSNFGSISCAQTHVTYPWPTGVGDLAVIFGQVGSASNIVSTIVDDQGGSLAGGDWILGKFQPDGGHSQSVVAYYRPNCPAGIQRVTVTFTSAQFCSFSGFWSNMIDSSSPLVGSVGGNPTGKTLAIGSFTPTSPDTIIFGFITETSGIVPGVPIHFRTQDPSYRKIAPDGGANRSCGFWGYLPGKPAVNPTLLSDTSFVASAGLALAFKTKDGAGSLKPAWLEPMFLMSFNPNGAAGGMPTTYEIDLPAEECDAVSITYDDSCGYASGAGPASRTSDSNHNTWSQTTPVVSGGSATVGFVDCVGGKFEAEGRLKFSSLPAAPQVGAASLSMEILGMVNCKERGDSQGGTGNETTDAPVTRNNVLSAAVVTKFLNEFIFIYTQEDRQTVTNITGSNGNPVNCMYDVGQYFSFDGDHDCGCAVQRAFVPGNYNYNIHWEPYEGAPNAPGQMCATAVAYRGKAAISPPQVANQIYVMP